MNQCREPARTLPRPLGVQVAALACAVAPWRGSHSAGHLCRAFRLPGFSLQTYSQLAHPIQQAKALGLQFHSRILDIDNIDVSVPSGGRGRPRGCEGVLIRMALSREE